MSKRSEVPINKYDLPELFEFPFGNETFILGINYNEEHDFFTVDLYKPDMTPLILGERMVAGQPLWQDFTRSDIPDDTLVPMNEANPAEPITFKNFGDSCRLYIDDINDEGDE